MNYESRFVEMLNTIRHSGTKVSACVTLDVDLQKEFPILTCKHQDFTSIMRDAYSIHFDSFSLRELIEQLYDSLSTHTVPTVSFEYADTTVVITVESDELCITLFDMEADVISVCNIITLFALVVNIASSVLNLTPGKLLYVCACAKIGNIKAYEQINYNAYQLRQTRSREEYENKSPKLVISRKPMLRFSADIKTISLIDYLP